MTTKTIREVLEAVASGKPLSDEAQEAAVRALQELDAIRQTAKVVTNPMAYPTHELVKASALVKALATEYP